MKIVIDVPEYPSAAGLATLRRLGDLQVECLQEQEPSTSAGEAQAARFRDAEALICSYPAKRLNVEEMRALRWIQVSSAGYDKIIGLGWAERGIRVTNARGCYETPIAEWNLAMMVMLTRYLRQVIRNQDLAVWDQSAVFQREIRGLTVGLWGYGGFARETARLAHCHGLRVHVLTRTGVRPRRDVYAIPGIGDPEGILPDRTFLAGDEIAFLRDLDFLVVAVPLTHATRGIIAERELQALPRTAYLLNPARGPIVQEAALLRALEEKWIAGAALDAQYQYPLPPQHPLWRMPNVILTPHISGAGRSSQSAQRVWDLFVQNVERFIQGKKLINELTAADLAGL